MLFEVQGIPQCVINQRGQWNCDHTHHTRADVAPWEAPDGWTVQGLPREEVPPLMCYTCSLCDAKLWEHELDEHTKVCN